MDIFCTTLPHNVLCEPHASQGVSPSVIWPYLLHVALLFAKVGHIVRCRSMLRVDDADAWRMQEEGESMWCVKVHGRSCVSESRNLVQFFWRAATERHCSFLPFKLNERRCCQPELRQDRETRNSTGLAASSNLFLWFTTSYRYRLNYFFLGCVTRLWACGRVTQPRKNTSADLCTCNA